MTDIKRLPSMRMEIYLDKGPDFLAQPTKALDNYGKGSRNKLRLELLLEQAELTKKPLVAEPKVRPKVPTITKPKTGKDRLKELKNKFEPLALADSESKGCTISLAELLGNVNTEIIWDFITTNFKPKESQ